MKVLIFADSHGYNMAMAFAVDREEPDAVIHLGDHAEDAREIERVFPAMPICRVRGNNDFDPEVPLNAVVTPGGVRIYITHGHRERVGMLSSGIVSQRAYEEHWRACLFRAYAPHDARAGEQRVGMQSGSISLPRGGPASYARLTIENGRATLLELVDEDGSLLRKESL